MGAPNRRPLTPEDAVRAVRYLVVLYGRAPDANMLLLRHDLPVPGGTLRASVLDAAVDAGLLDRHVDRLGGYRATYTVAITAPEAGPESKIEDQAT